MTDKFICNKIIKFWIPDDKYHPEWFIQHPIFDNYIYENYSSYVDYFQYKLDFITSEEILACIIVLDQFVRNIKRVYLFEMNERKYFNKALVLSELWIEDGYHLTQPITHTIFALMPMRHSLNIKIYKKLKSILSDLSDKHKDNEVFKKFYFHTERCYKKLII